MTRAGVPFPLVIKSKNPKHSLSKTSVKTPGIITLTVQLLLGSDIWFLAIDKHSYRSLISCLVQCLGATLPMIQHDQIVGLCNLSHDHGTYQEKVYQV